MAAFFDSSGYTITLPSETPKLRFCNKCGYHDMSVDAVCPQCRGPLQTSGSIRIRGLLIILLGGILVGLMSYLTIWTIDAANPNTEGGASFTGSDDQLMAILALFALLIFVGFAAALAGFWQLIFGRRNKYIVWASVGFGVITAAVTYLVYLRLE